MDTSKCYTLEDFTVREYGGTKYLSTAKEGSKFYPIADIGNIKTSEQSNDDQDQTILNAVIIGVLQLDSYKSCLRCKARVESISDTLGRCSKADCAIGLMSVVNIHQPSYSACQTRIHILFTCTVLMLKSLLVSLLTKKLQKKHS